MKGHHMPRQSRPCIQSTEVSTSLYLCISILSEGDSRPLFHVLEHLVELLEGRIGSDNIRGKENQFAMPISRLWHLTIFTLLLNFCQVFQCLATKITNVIFKASCTPTATSPSLPRCHALCLLVPVIFHLACQRVHFTQQIWSGWKEQCERENFSNTTKYFYSH